MDEDRTHIRYPSLQFYVVERVRIIMDALFYSGILMLTLISLNLSVVLRESPPFRSGWDVNLCKAKGVIVHTCTIKPWSQVKRNAHVMGTSNVRQLALNDMNYLPSLTIKGFQASPLRGSPKGECLTISLMWRWRMTSGHPMREWMMLVMSMNPKGVHAANAYLTIGHDPKGHTKWDGHACSTWRKGMQLQSHTL